MRRDSPTPPLPFPVLSTLTLDPHQPFQLPPRYAEGDSRFPRWLPQLKEAARAEACLLLATGLCFHSHGPTLAFSRRTSSPQQDFHVICFPHEELALAEVTELSSET